MKGSVEIDALGFPYLLRSRDWMLLTLRGSAPVLPYILY